MGVAVLVLGDLGRSPRMQYHASELSNNDVVDLIGISDSLLPRWVSENRKIRVTSVPACTFGLFSPFLPYSIISPFKVIVQFICLLWVLFFRIPRPSHLLVQNPPSIPTLIVAQFFCKLRGTKLVIDWHNLAYTVLAMKTGKTSFITKLAKRIEECFGRNAFAHFFVTEALCDHVSRVWKIRGRKIVLYDQPQLKFHRLDEEDRTCFLRTKLEHQFARVSSYRPGVDFLLVSSTSWTADEDFDMFLDAFVYIDKLIQKKISLSNNDNNNIEDQSKNIFFSNFNKLSPPLVIYAIVTGKGPMRAEFESKVRLAGLKNSIVMTGWLRAEDYPKILGSADLGVSMHTSSSGLDLPMKVVDMFGCGLPVCAKSFECIKELVVDEVGLTFHSSHELGDQILKFINNRENLEILRKNVLKKYLNQRWTSEWKKKAFDVFN